MESVLSSLNSYFKKSKYSLHQSTYFIYWALWFLLNGALHSDSNLTNIYCAPIMWQCRKKGFWVFFFNCGIVDSQYCDISWLLTFAFQTPWWKGPLLWVLVLEGLAGVHWTIQLQLLQHYWSGHRQYLSNSKLNGLCWFTCKLIFRKCLFFLGLTFCIL